MRGLFFAGLFFAVLLWAPAAFADSIPGLSEMQFRTELIGMTRAYDKDVTLQQAERNPYIYERLIVKTYDSSLDPEEYGAVDAIRDTDGHYILQFDSPFAARRAERRLRKKDSVLYVEPDLPVYVQGNTTAARKLQASDYWGAAYTGCDVYADYIQQKGVSGNTKVAVVDSGVRKTHELFRGRIDSSREKDYVNNDRNAADDLGHGTNVAGIIAECSPGLDQLDIIPIKVIDNNGDGSSAVIAQAVKDLAGIRKGKKHCFFGKNHVVVIQITDKGVMVSIKRMSKDPWLDVETLYQVNQQAKGKITKLQSYGAFLELSSGIQGLLHKKEMSLDGTKEPSEIVSEGQEIDVIITSIEKADRKMSFSIKPFLN